MKVDAWIKATHITLSAHSSSPRLDSEVLLCDAMGQNKAWLFSHGEDVIDQDKLETLDLQIKRRIQGEPLAYIRGFAEFYGRSFAVNKHVLVPRPESETIIELLLADIGATNQNSRNISVIDVGTGSGALGITASLEIQKLRATGLVLRTTLLDIDKDCLRTARINAETYNVDAELLEGNLLAPLSGCDARDPQLAILANLPYVPDSYQINNAAEHEPKIALFGGADGLELYRTMFLQLEELVSHGCTISVYTESLPLQHEALLGIALNSGFNQVEEKDLIQVFTL